MIKTIGTSILNRFFTLTGFAAWIVCLNLVSTVSHAQVLKSIREIHSGYNGTPVQAWDPFILQEGSIEHLFFGNIFCQDINGKLSFTKNPTDPQFCKALVFGIGYGFRDIQKTTEFTFRQTPVLLPSANSWDNNYVETPSVAKRNQTYYLAYSAWPKLPKNNKRYQIGITSLDSKNLASDLMNETILFNRLQDSPIIPRNSDAVTGFDRENTQEPSLIYNEKLDRFEIFYVGLRSPTALAPDEPIQAIESLKLGRLCFDSHFQKIICSLNEAPLLENANMPEVHFMNGQYLLFYSDLSDLKEGFPYNYQNIYARASLDGVSWSKPVSVLQISASNINENAGIHSPSFTMNSSGELNLVYQGWGLFPAANCLMNGSRIMLPFQTGMCQQTSLIFSTVSFPSLITPKVN